MQDIEIDVGEFYLRTLNIDEDLTNYCYWMSNPQNNEYIVSAHTDYGLLKLQQFIEDCNSDNSTILLGIFDKYKNTHIGNIKFDRIDSKNGSATMGILIGEKKYRGRGLAGKVIKSSVNWLNCNLDIKKFYLGVDKNNTIAIDLYVKLGFEFIKKTLPEGYSMLLDITGKN